MLVYMVACWQHPAKIEKPDEAEPPPGLEATPPARSSDCSKAKNVCPTYANDWHDGACPDGVRCVTFQNQCSKTVALSYQIGCNGDGTKGAPQCDCTSGPVLQPGSSASFQIEDGNYDSCLPYWKPECLTAGLAVLANVGSASCTKGTKLEFTAGNRADLYGQFDSYDIDIEKDFYSVPVRMAPRLTCAADHQNHDCRPLWCGSSDCPDAYSTPTSGGCPDGRSPQVGCQDTFSKNLGYEVVFCPEDCTVNGCPSCQDAKSCP